MMDRRNFIKAGVAAGLAGSVGFRHFIQDAYGEAALDGLTDPAVQPKFTNYAPNALDPGFIYQPDRNGRYKIRLGEALHRTGLINPKNGRRLRTRIWGYGDKRDGIITWPGRTFQVQNMSAGGPGEIEVIWQNGLDDRERKTHILPVDTNLHWCFALHGHSSRNGHDYTQYSIREDGVPIITHLHGGHSDFEFDGNPEFFYTADGEVYGPQWDFVPGGFTEKFRYDNNVPAGNLWYHDHALGITRLNVYAGLAGFYFVRDQHDTGAANNPIGLPAEPYELAYAIQDRMFRENGALFYSAYPGDPFYDDFITDEGAVLPPNLFPGGGPTALAEFFGDHILVNGIIWPKEDVERRNYRMRLLNGTDSRFMQLQFREIPADMSNASEAELLAAAGDSIPFDVIGSDQGFGRRAKRVTELLFEPGARYDVVINFRRVGMGSRVVMFNQLGDAPYGGDLPAPEDLFPDRRTDRVMAFDVVKPFNNAVPDNYSRRDFNGGPWTYAGNTNSRDRVRKVALFEGKDEFGRLQPLLGTAQRARDYQGNLIRWPNTPEYANAGLVGPMEGAIPWHSPTTENPALGSTEVWEIWNMTGDAHPVHLHLVNFQVLGRQEIVWDSNTTEDDRVIPNDLHDAPAGDGTFLRGQTVVQHNGAVGNGFKIRSKTKGAKIALPPEIVENSPKDMVTALPGQVTRIKATFDKPGRYVWHCHILSHEDHEMMRVLHVGAGA